jgi:subtilisin family serine protease
MLCNERKAFISPGIRTHQCPSGLAGWRNRCATMGLLFGLALVRFDAQGQITSASSFSATTPKYRADRILIMPKPGINPTTLVRFHSEHHAEVLGQFAGIGGLQIVRLPAGETVPGCLAKYAQSGLVAFAEPDYEGQVAAIPNDPRFLDGTLWGLNNTGQNGGTADADIDAPEGWDVLNSASNIVVAVVDTGIRYTHEDLAANMWVNPVDGGHGWNALTGTNDPYDSGVPFSISHGTLVAGILGAVGNNGKGVAGVAWRLQIMACQGFTNGNGVGAISDVITCLDYARTNGARIINASWGFSPDSLALSNAVASTRNAGMIMVAASGNSSLDIDVTPTYPASYAFDNILSVAYTSRTDALGAASNFGATNVDLAAPGEQIYSTFVAADNIYAANSGTSFAAAYVSGVCALMLAKYPTETPQQIIARVQAATDPLPALTGKCVTGGRLNLRKALSPPIQLTPLSAPGVLPFQFRVAGGPNRTCVIEVSTNLAGWSPVFTDTTSASGSFDFTDDQSTSSTRRFFRATSTP